MKASLGLSLVLVAACGRPFDIKTAPGFVEVKDQPPASFAYRASTPELVVVGVRVVDLQGEGSGELSFWTRAMTLQLHDASGYTLLETRDVRSLDGVPGKQLRFSHDDGGKPFLYWTTFFVSGKHLIIAESGGEKATFERYEPNVEWMLASVRVR